LDEVITLGLPRALESDGALRSALYGSERLLDEDPERRLAALYDGTASLTGLLKQRLIV
jgi:hypothetical protein